MALSPRTRIAVAGLTLSASAFIGLATSEGYTDGAVVPVKGDVPTYGFGMTHRPDGSPVQMGDKTTPVKSLRQTLDHLNGDQDQIKKCVGDAELLQEEYDELINFSYQFGVPTTCHSSMVAYAKVGDYKRSCEAYLQYRFVGKGLNKYDCSTMIDDGAGHKVRNKRCWGVWERSNKHYQACTAAQTQ